MTTFVGLVAEETFARCIDNLYVHWWDWTSVNGIMAILHSKEKYHCSPISLPPILSSFRRHSHLEGVQPHFG